MLKFRPLLLVILVISIFSAHSSVVQPGDGPYYRLRKGQILYIYEPSLRDSIPQFAGYMQTIRRAYDQSFNWKLDEEEDLILTSPKQQVANAYATVSPNIKSVWFPSGPAMLEQMAESSWFFTLATHETSHLYQLNAKGPVNSAVKSVFGNTAVIVPFVWPIFIHPNMLTPTFLVEGNAVLNESRANMGGRLHSGEARALVLAQIRAGQINPTRLINDEFRFPFGQTPYLQGGYFQAHLAAKYGVDKTNQFFLAQGDHYFWPFILNQTFREHFGSSYPQEIHEYNREMEGLAKNQQQSSGRQLVETKYFSPLNHDDSRIFFLASDGIQPAKLHIFDKARLETSVEELDLPLGKVFWEGGTPLVSTSAQHDLHHIEYSLYGEHHAFDPRFRGQIVGDQRAQKTVSLDAANSWLESHVLVNGEPYDVAVSMPILDSDGNVYYFRQNGTERVLYKNRHPVFKYEGFYGKLTEVAKDGSIYFIGNTDYGSTLYRYKNGEIVRVLVSDLVVDARQVDDTRFLSIEVFADGHRAMLSDRVNKPAAPATYSYGFANYNLVPEKIPDVEQVKEDERTYNSFSQLRYSGLDFTSQYDSTNGFAMFLSGNFIDPIQYQQYNLGFSGSELGSQRFFAGYSFSKYLPVFSTRYLYQKQIWTQQNGAARKAYESQVSLGMTLPLLRWQRWDAAWSLMGLYSNFDNRMDPSATTPPLITLKRNETYGTWNSLNLTFAENPEPPIALFPWRSLVLNYQNKLESEPGAWRKKYNTSFVQAKYQHGFPMEFYGTLSGNVAWAENNDVFVGYDPQPLSYDIRVNKLTPNENFTAKTASSARFEFTKVIDTPAYWPRFPVSVDRVAPFVVAQGIFLDGNGHGNGDYPPNIFEWGYGADVQLLILHLAHAKIRLLNAYDTRHPMKSSKQAQLEMHYDF